VRAGLLLALLAAGCVDRTRVRAEGTCVLRPEAPVWVYSSHGGWLVLRNVGTSPLEILSAEREPVRLEPGQALHIDEAWSCTVRTASSEDALLRYDLCSDQYFPAVGVIEEEQGRRRLELPRQADP
jgi:hypothetical protein